MTFNKFDDVYLLTGGGAGTEVVSVRVFQFLTARFDIGAAAAQALVLAVLLVVLLILYLRFFATVRRRRRMSGPRRRGVAERPTPRGGAQAAIPPARR